MEQTRKLLLLAETDSKAFDVPLVSPHPHPHPHPHPSLLTPHPSPLTPQPALSGTSSSPSDYVTTVFGGYWAYAGWQVKQNKIIKTN